MIHQNEISPLIFDTEATTPVIASVFLNDEIVGKLTGFPVNGKLTYYLESLLQNIKIQEDTPDFVTKYRITKPNYSVKVTADNQNYTDTLTCGNTFPVSGKLTNNQKRSAIDAPYQVVYFVQDAAFARLSASVNGTEFVELELIKVLDVGTGKFLIINYHQYYQELNLSDYDTVTFKFDTLPFVEVITFNAIYTDSPFFLVMRNQYGFWDCFKFFGNQENNLEFSENTMENYKNVSAIYNEITEKVSIETGLLEQNEKVIIANNLMNLTFFEYRDFKLFSLIKAMKNIQSFNFKDAQDTLKLEFSYSAITRRRQ